jgi:hypothetical protein
MFWLAFGTAAAVIGLALMTIGATRSAPGANLLASLWFDGGLGLLAFGGLLLLWALALYLLRRRAEAHAALVRVDSRPEQAKESAELEAVKGYYRERERLIETYERQEKDRHRKDGGSV